MIYQPNDSKELLQKTLADIAVDLRSNPLQRYSIGVDDPSSTDTSERIPVHYINRGLPFRRSRPLLGVFEGTYGNEDSNENYVVGVISDRGVLEAAMPHLERYGREIGATDVKVTYEPRA